MHCALAVLIAPLALGLLAAPPKPPKPAKNSRKQGAEAPIVDGDAGKALDDWLTDADRFKGGFSGVVLVARDGRILLQKGYGVADAGSGAAIGKDALFDWCSVTKQWTAAAVLKLEMQKKLDVDAPLSKVLKDVPKDKAKVTLRHLMNHTSGLSTAAEGFDDGVATDREAFVRWALALPMTSEPGSKWEYNNTAYFLLAAIIEKVSGATYERYVKDNLFKPAGLADTFFIGDPDLDMSRVPKDDRGKGVQFAYGNKLSWGYRGAGGIVASVADMLAWDRALRGTKVLSEAAKKKYYEVGLDGYACGWFVKNADGATEYSHSGHTGKVFTYYLRRIDPDVVVAIALNEEPAVHPEVTANGLAAIARNGKAP